MFAMQELLLSSSRINAAKDRGANAKERMFVGDKHSLVNTLSSAMGFRCTALIDTDCSRHISETLLLWATGLDKRVPEDAVYRPREVVV